IIGKGTINLATEQVDLHLVPYATSPSLASFAVPMTIKGPLSNPRVGPDAAAIAKGAPRTVLTAPLTALGQLGGLVGIGGGDAPDGGSAKTTPAGGGLLQDVGRGAQDAVDALKGVLP